MTERLPPEKTQPLRMHIASAVRGMRTARGWTQAELAARLGVSQAQMSVKEQGGTSFSAEQLIEVMRLFNAPISDFVPPVPREAELQNALVRHGARHLREIADITPTERFQRAGDAVREVLLGPASARLLTALAPVLVENIGAINLHHLGYQLGEHGRDQRLGWLVENTREAVAVLAEDLLSLRAKHRQITLSLEHYLDTHPPPVSAHEMGSAAATDLLDDDLRSRKSLAAVWSGASPISRRWGVASALQPADFAQAIREADESR